MENKVEIIARPLNKVAEQNNNEIQQSDCTECHIHLNCMLAILMGLGITILHKALSVDGTTSTVFVESILQINFLKAYARIQIKANQ